MSLLSTRALSINIGELVICKNFDFDLKSGELWGVLGGNGIGKTTLLNTLAGLHAAESGDIDIQEKAIEQWKKKQLASVLGVLFQDSLDTFPTTVLETALSGRYPHLPFFSLEGNEDVELAKQALSDVGLEDLMERQVDTLSGGERRRLALATLLVQNPLLWLLDEPTNHLDVHHQIILLNFIIEKVKTNNGALLMVLHDVNLVSRFCTHVMMMIDHNNIICGPVHDILNIENLSALYQHPIKSVQSEEKSFFFPE
jgi:iron complex transport system ATP-binding protein